MRRTNPFRTCLHVECLEDRTAPATLLGPTAVTYQDADGDQVRVSFSRPILTPATVNAVLAFDTGTVDGNNTTRQQLRAIDLTSVTASAAGTSITLKAVPSPGTDGDGLAAVGHINALGMDLGAVNIDGDLGRVVVGDDTITTIALKRLTVHSIGRFGTTTGAPEMYSWIYGALNDLYVKSDVTRASIRVLGGEDARIGRVFIGGSLIGGSENSIGHIFSSGNMRNVIVRGDLVGGTGYDTGLIWSLAGLERVTVGGSIKGGLGGGSGGVFAEGYLGRVTVHGNLSGGSGEESGSIRSLGRIARVTVVGSVEGGSGANSARIHSDVGIGTVTVRGNLKGAEGTDSGSVHSRGEIERVAIGGSVQGGTNTGAGRIYSNGNMGTIAIHGGLIGDVGWDSGSVLSNGSLTRLTVGGSVQGGAGRNTGLIWANAGAGTIVIGGDLEGGTSIVDNPLWYMGVVGGKHIDRLVLGGSFIAGRVFTSTNYHNNGVIIVHDHLGSVLIKGNVIGNSTNLALIAAGGRAEPSTTTDVAIGSLRVLGRVELGLIRAGLSFRANADAQIGEVNVGGDWIASSIAAGASAGFGGFYGDSNDRMLVGSGVKDDPLIMSRIDRVTIRGAVLGTALSGDHFGIVAEEIGSVTFTGQPVVLKVGAHNDHIPVRDTNDFQINEI